MHVERLVCVCAVIWCALCARRGCPSTDYCAKQRRHKKSDAMLATFIPMMTMMMLMPRFCARCSLLSCYLLPLFSVGFWTWRGSVFISCYYFTFMYIKIRARTRLSHQHSLIYYFRFLFSLSLPLSLSRSALSHSLSFLFISHCDRSHSVPRNFQSSVLGSFVFFLFWISFSRSAYYWRWQMRWCFGVFVLLFPSFIFPLFCCCFFSVRDNLCVGKA